MPQLVEVQHNPFSADPFEAAGFTDQVAAPAARGADPFESAGFVDRGPGTATARGPEVSAMRAAGEGYLDTASFGFRDEAKGLSEASGLPDWLGGFRAPSGAVRVGSEQLRGATYDSDPMGNPVVTDLAPDRGGPATQRYIEARDESRRTQEAAREQHPGAYIGGQVAGGVVGAAALPVGTTAQGAGWLARAGRAAGAGALAGGLYGAGSGEGLEDTLKQGAIGAGTGAVVGAVASPVLDVATWGAGKVASGIRSAYDIARAELRPSTAIENIAASRVLGAHAADAPAFTPAEAQAASAAGIPRTLADIGGENTRALARSAANISPDARAALTDVAQDRFAGQSTRASDFIKNLTGGQHAADVQARLEEVARATNKGAYAKAYQEGAGGLWSPELERLAGSDAVTAAMQRAATTARDESIVSGGGAFNPKITFTPDGRMQFNKGPTGVPTYPDLQYWDQVRRELSDAAQRAGRGTEEARRLGRFASALNTELDKLVPSYAEARSGAAAAFGAQDALEAGRNFVTAKGRNTEYATALGKMSDPERDLFARGFASELADKIRELKGNQNVIKQAFLDSPASKQRILMALGPQRANELEMYLRAEGLADRLRGALGNSTTTRQLIESGLIAGAGGYGAYKVGQGDLTPGSIFGAVLLGGAGLYGKYRLPQTQQAIAKRVGEMLVSNDPQILSRGVKTVARTQWLRDAMRAAGEKFEGTIPSTGAELGEPVAQGVAQ